uniref:DUF834 domain-containing protein n=1 Tax=Oryza glumipatula TaxID=40148 RepID=A0A0E0BE71_9ORYZ
MKKKKKKNGTERDPPVSLYTSSSCSPPLLQAPFACGDGGPTVAVRGDDNGAAVSLAEAVGVAQRAADGAAASWGRRWRGGGLGTTKARRWARPHGYGEREDGVREERWWGLVCLDG